MVDTTSFFLPTQFIACSVVKHEILSRILPQCTMWELHCNLWCMNIDRYRQRRSSQNFPATTTSSKISFGTLMLFVHRYIAKTHSQWYLHEQYLCCFNVRTTACSCRPFSNLPTELQLKTCLRSLPGLRVIPVLMSFYASEARIWVDGLLFQTQVNVEGAEVACKHYHTDLSSQPGYVKYAASVSRYFGCDFWTISL